MRGLRFAFWKKVKRNKKNDARVERRFQMQFSVELVYADLRRGLASKLASIP